VTPLVMHILLQRYCIMHYVPRVRCTLV